MPSDDSNPNTKYIKKKRIKIILKKKPKFVFKIYCLSLLHSFICARTSNTIKLLKHQNIIIHKLIIIMI